MSQDKARKRFAARCKQIAEKYKLGKMLVTGHKYGYFEEAALLFYEAGPGQAKEIIKEELPCKPILGEAFVKGVLGQYTKEEISFGKMVELFNEKIALASQQVKAEEVTEMAVCEIDNLVLHENQLYRFHKRNGCKDCEEYYAATIPQSKNSNPL